jgi:hypothetical protein
MGWGPCAPHNPRLFIGCLIYSSNGEINWFQWTSKRPCRGLWGAQGPHK